MVSKTSVCIIHPLLTTHAQLAEDASTFWKVREAARKDARKNTTPGVPPRASKGRARSRGRPRLLAPRGKRETERTEQSSAAPKEQEKTVKEKKCW